MNILDASEDPAVENTMTRLDAAKVQSGAVDADEGCPQCLQSTFRLLEVAG